MYNLAYFIMWVVSTFHFYCHSVPRVMVTGIYRAMPLRVNPRHRNVKSVYRTYIDVIHYRKADYKKLRERDEDGDEEEV